MSDYVSEKWRAIFEYNGLRTFEDFWQLQAQWFEDPNYRRGGWSGVSRCELKLQSGGHAPVFMKRQENHFTKTWRHPLRGMATLVREFDNLRRLTELKLATVAPLYFAHRRVKGQVRAILVTEELSGLQPLETLTRQWIEKGWPALSVRRKIIEAIARAVRDIHLHGFKHNCLYPKHVFVSWPLDGSPGSRPVTVKLIDLEKAKRSRLRRNGGLKDVATLNRRTEGWSLKDRWRFFKTYLESDTLEETKRKWRRLARRTKKKVARQSRKSNSAA